MKGLLFYLAYSFLWLITLLPLKVLYGFSDLISFLMSRVIRYRRKTVLRNLGRSFPEKSGAEIRRIQKKFYRQLSDYFLEWIYRIHLGKEELSRRMHYTNPEILRDFYAQGKSIMLLLSHYGNWEWASLLSRLSQHNYLVIYKPLRNEYFDRLFLDLRCRFGMRGVPMESILRQIIEHRKESKPFVVFSLADQRPRGKHSTHWTRFLNQDTPVFTGSEKIARKFDMPVLLLVIDKVKRGYYRAEFRVLSEDPAREPEFELTRRYLGILEEEIREKPELWLWTHKRWKHRRENIRNPVDIGPPLPWK